MEWKNRSMLLLEKSEISLYHEIVKLEKSNFLCAVNSLQGCLC